MLGSLIIATFALRVVSSLFLGGGRPMTAVLPLATLTPRSRRSQGSRTRLARLGDRPPVLPAGGLDVPDVLPQRAERREPIRRRSARHSPSTATGTFFGQAPGPVPGRRCSTRSGQASGSTLIVLTLAVPGRVRTVDQAGPQVDRRDVLLPVDEDVAAGGGPTADLPVREEHPFPRQRMAAGHPLHRDEPADCRLDDALVPRRSAAGDHGSGLDRRRRC